MKPDLTTECGEDDEILAGIVIHKVWPGHKGSDVILAGIVIHKVWPGHKGSDVEPPEDPELDYDIVDEDGNLLPEDAISDKDEERLVEMAWDLLKARATDEP